MQSNMKTEKESISAKELHLLRNAFGMFEENSKRLEAAYAKMQEDFKNLNLELDSKNAELALCRQDGES